MQTDIAARVLNKILYARHINTWRQHPPDGIPTQIVGLTQAGRVRTQTNSLAEENNAGLLIISHRPNESLCDADTGRSYRQPGGGNGNNNTLVGIEAG